MNRVFRSLSLFAVLAVYVMNCAEAQTKFSIHIGGSLPFGKYADYSLPQVQHQMEMILLLGM